MVKSLTTVGNSQAIILPKHLIEKYHLEKVTLEETSEGILIRPHKSADNPFQKKVEAARASKAQIYERMRAAANDPEIIDFYQQESQSADIDLNISDE
ncbi:MAG: AbrB/MazE/SpoVT family DNA-binding domain-containing protein [Imperialibacter sp.]|uniref:AbrB/MazE/SpoVT family DNA-binding domain-containing protein n=1 Tax=Imperialibacter sp. TaxID=2038411 RepID=UPI0032EE5886